MNSTKSHSFQHGTVELVKINSNGLYIASNLLTSTILSYLNTCTSDIQSQINSKQASGSFLLTSGGTMTSNINWLVIMD